MNRKSPNRPMGKIAEAPRPEANTEMQELRRQQAFFRETLKFSDIPRTGPVPLLGKWGTAHVYLALYSAHLRDVYCAIACEAGIPYPVERRLDLLQYKMGSGREFIVYEIKVTTADFLREIRSPKKVQASLKIGHRFYYVTPRGLLNKHRGLLPKGAGLIEVYQDERNRWLGNWRARTAVAARATKPKDPMCLADIFVRRALDHTLNYPMSEIGRHVGILVRNYYRAIEAQERKEWVEKMEAEG